MGLDAVQDLATLSVQSLDGTPISYRAWATSGEPPKHAVIVLHGIGLHSLMYRVVADALAPHGYLVIGVDLRGHGHSGGTHGVVPTAAQIGLDLDPVLDDVRARYRAERLYVIGESMGGLIALNYIAITDRAMDGVIFVAPALRIHSAQIFQIDSLKIVASFARSPFRATIDLAGVRLDEASIDEEFKARKRGDGLAINRVPFAYLLSLNRLMSHWPAKARRVRTPALVMHGGLDRVLDWHASRKLYEVISAPDKTFRLFPDAHHTLFWDPASADVFKAILDWLDARKAVVAI